ncbi:hypothetical protein M911_14570 [Ectothiorhodospira haloalkaliphila]|uniref:Uncharacterized protein n=2 Tax=Ectothiorhodospira haloalkaliphila TaxID=421628 RepID=W8L8L6_9GAMM|nr:MULTISPECIES: hypothetical protein [Ectothiorhodospira]AHK80170.1 hypothetical protein M911_14570 [Ectothiorhodospira haloalkaliphila]MCG5493693.1 hypothetical protein [Ectothiorhodospira variabilis]MCG5497040.1 hypothetical protein [Ectothiorhodospira variabilis]MCG5505231.1 hypothetical protein [Ectothiorhodospira variabilis]MCG5508408.1 hypothetical protein [Ectothiorhodospira variabilis]
MNDSQPTSPRRRLQSLLAIPDSQRTEEQWDELIELEISLAPVNQKKPGEQSAEPAGRAPRGGGPKRPRAGGNGGARKKTFSNKKTASQGGRSAPRGAVSE